jgi:hypothetical protein
MEGRQAHQRRHNDRQRFTAVTHNIDRPTVPASTGSALLSLCQGHSTAQHGTAWRPHVSEIWLLPPAAEVRARWTESQETPGFHPAQEMHCICSSSDTSQASVSCT